MTASGKTLTVTYGAFACTIDGYDDPMPVLRSVAAFFRELTAEDPTFGTVAMATAESAPMRPSPLSADEVASLATPEPGESRLTATVSTQAARAVLFTPEHPGEEGEEQDLLAATMPRPRDDAQQEEAPFVLTPDLRVDQPALPPGMVAAAPALANRRDSAPIELMPHELVQDEPRGGGQVPPVELAAFVDGTGAASVTERMEAVAAHALVLEGRESLSRPALLRAMQGVVSEPLGFEDGLKAFGTLLRDGRLRKADYGRYTLAETSPYLAEARAYLG